MDQLIPPPGPQPQDEATERAARAISLPLLVQAGAIIGVVALVAGLVARQPVPAARPLVFPAQERMHAEEYSVAAQSITPITSLTAGTTGALQVSADRIDLWARTSSSTATLNLVEYSADDAKWAKVGADCAVTTDLTLCRYVAKRGTRYWHVYKASGSMAYVGLEAMTLPTGAALGTIEPTGATSLSSVTGTLGVANGGTGAGTLTGVLHGNGTSAVTAGNVALASEVSGTLPTTNGGTGLASFTANCVFYSSSTSAVGQLCCSDGQYVKWASGVPTCTAAPGGTYVSEVAYYRFDNAQIGSSIKAPVSNSMTIAGTWGTTASTTAGFPVDATSSYTIYVYLDGVVGSGNTLSIKHKCTTTPGGSLLITSGAGGTGTVAVGDTTGFETWTPGAAGECAVGLVTLSTGLGRGGYARVVRTSTTS